jgi:hypothetical protein
MKFKIIFFVLMLFVTNITIAKSYKFKMDHPYEVSIKRSTYEGKKMLEVFGYGGTVNSAMDQAMQDAVAAIVFCGIPENGEFGEIPSIMPNKEEDYQNHKEYFNKFFKKGEFMNYVKNVNSNYPSGPDNVSTSRGRRVRLVVIVDWKGLEARFRADGLNTSISKLGEIQ